MLPSPIEEKKREEGDLTHPEESLLEEAAAVGRGDVLGERSLDLGLVLGPEFGRGGNHGIAERALSVGTSRSKHGGDAGGGRVAR